MKDGFHQYSFFSLDLIDNKLYYSAQMFTYNMKKEEIINKSIILDLENYALPGKTNQNRIFDAIPRIIAETGFDIFNYESVFTDEATMDIIRI